ncbi:hypothetical protein PMAYCL1PPCAC_13720, partial [Pristionchus mayeri]
NSEDITPVDRDFFKEMAQETLFSVMLAANYLDIKELLDLTVKTLANEAKKCTTAEELRAKFGVKKDFTPEQEAKMDEQHVWCKQ